MAPFVPSVQPPLTASDLLKNLHPWPCGDSSPAVHSAVRKVASWCLESTKRAQSGKVVLPLLAALLAPVSTDGATRNGQAPPSAAGLSPWRTPRGASWPTHSTVRDVPPIAASCFTQCGEVYTGRVCPGPGEISPGICPSCGCLRALCLLLHNAPLPLHPLTPLCTSATHPCSSQASSRGSPRDCRRLYAALPSVAVYRRPGTYALQLQWILQMQTYPGILAHSSSPPAVERHRCTKRPHLPSTVYRSNRV